MNNVKNIFIILIKIIAVIIVTYAVMAVITHFSLHYELSGYKFSDSLTSIFDFETDIFSFFVYFMIINALWVTVAVLIYKLIKKI